LDYSEFYHTRDDTTRFAPNAPACRCAETDVPTVMRSRSDLYKLRTLARSGKTGEIVNINNLFCLSVRSSRRNFQEFRQALKASWNSRAVCLLAHVEVLVSMWRFLATTQRRYER
jgi:hypothetical protein